MRRIFTLIVFSILGIAVSFSQTWNWTKGIGNKDAESYTSKVLPLINGETLGITQYYDGFGNKLILSTSDENGDFTWIKIIDGNVRFVDADVDSKGNIYIVGYSYNVSIKYDSLTVQTTSGQSSFVIKFSPEKNIEWIKFPEHGEFFVYEDFEILNDNSLVFCGMISNSLISLYLVEILDSNLNLKSKKTFPKSLNGYSTFTKVESDDDDNIYVTGYFNNEIRINDSLIFVTSIESGYDHLILKFDKELNIINAKSFPEYSEISNLYLNKNELIALARYRDKYADLLFLRFDGDLQITKQEVLSRKGKGGVDCIFIPTNIETDENGNFYISTYNYCDSFQFGDILHISVPPILNGSNSDCSLLKYDNDFKELKMWIMGGEFDDYINDFHIFNEDCFLIAGSYKSAKINFGSIVLTNNSPLVNVGPHWFPSYSRNAFGYYASYGIKNPPTSLSIQKSISLNIFPNPTSDFLNIRFDKNVLETGSFEIYSLDGKLIDKQFFALGLEEVQIDVRYYPKGMYLVRFSSSNGELLRKFVKN